MEYYLPYFRRKKQSQNKLDVKTGEVKLDVINIEMDVA